MIQNENNENKFDESGKVPSFVLLGCG